MKKILALCMTAFVLFTTALPCSAKNGDVIGQALYTDIVATINGYPIESFNVNGYTYIVAEDLEHYGFSVWWDGANRHLHVSKDVNKNCVTSAYMPEYISRSMIGTVARKILKTDIETYFDGYLVESYNINGETIVLFDVMDWYGELKWHPESRTISAKLDWMEYIVRNDATEWRGAYSSILANEGGDQYATLADLDHDDIPELIFSTSEGCFLNGYSYKNGRIYELALNEDTFQFTEFERYIHTGTGERRVETTQWYHSMWYMTEWLETVYIQNGKLFSSSVYGWEMEVVQSGRNYTEKTSYHSYRNGSRYTISENEYNRLVTTRYNGWKYDTSYKQAKVYFSNYVKKNRNR